MCGGGGAFGDCAAFAEAGTGRWAGSPSTPSLQPTPSFNKHFTDPPQPLRSMGAQSHSVPVCSFHHVHNNYHPAVAPFPCNITDGAHLEGLTRDRARVG